MVPRGSTMIMPVGEASTAERNSSSCVRRCVRSRVILVNPVSSPASLCSAVSLPIKAPRLDWRHLAGALGIFLFIWLLMFSSFFTNAAGVPDSIRTYSSWFHRAAGDSAHIHPWHFYFDRLLFFHVHNGPIWSEGLIFVLALIGAAAGFARKGLSDANASFVRFL